MAHRNGLQGSLDLSLESMLSSPKVETVQSAPEEKTEQLKQVHKPAKSSSSWRQRGLCLSESIMFRLKLESLKTGKSLSEVADDCLNRYLPNNRIAS